MSAVVQTAITIPAGLGRMFARWMMTKTRNLQSVTLRCPVCTTRTIGVEQMPTTYLKPNGRIEVNWPENLRDKCGLFDHTYREVYLQTFSSCCFHDITYDKDIADKYLARPDFYRLNISLENDCNGTSSDAYMQLTFSLKYIEFSGGYNFASLFSAEYRKDTGWVVVSGEGEVLMGSKE